MASLLLLGALCALPLTHAHMQMTNPSPFRDPHSNRASEPKDYDILKPLRADGSDFACKGYHLNTPWTTVATYEAGGRYKMHLQGSATHGGGSCQLSMSFDGGNEFKVIKSIEGGCPLQKDYEFTVPPELGIKLNGKTTGLFAWTWFNKIGNREMYMNCAAVDVVPKGRSKRDVHEPRTLDPRDTAISNVAAQSALSSYPSLFVANLAKVNGCVTKEAQNVVFDTPGSTVEFADGTSRSARPSFGKGECTGRGNKDAGSSSSSSSSPPPSPPGGGSSSPGNSGQWQPEKQSQSSSGSCANANDGQYHPECYGGQSNKQKSSSGSSESVPAPKQAAAKPVRHAQSVQDVKTGKEPSAKVEKELDAYLETLYSGAAKAKRSECQNVKGTCHTPNRWVKRGACVWECSRKGRRSSTHIPVTVPDVLNSMGQPIQARQLDTLAAVPLTLTTTPPVVQPTLLPVPTQEQLNFDLFLTYLSRLQSTVIECIRGIAAISPKSIPADPASILSAPRQDGTPARVIPSKHKRQLIVPFTTAKPYNLTSPPSSFTAARVPDVLSALRSLMESILEVFGASRPIDSASRNSTTTITTTTTAVDSSMTTTSTSTSLSFHLGHGPVVPDGVSLHWPAPSFFAGIDSSSSTSTVATSTLLSSSSLSSPYPSSPSPPSASTITTTTPTPYPSNAALPTPTNIAQLLPWLTGPGPVIPPGTVLQWNNEDDNAPGEVDNLEDMPMVVNDLEPGSEEAVKQFFEDLKKSAEDGEDD